MDIYPTEYICEKCGNQEQFSKEEHQNLREMFGDEKELQEEKKNLPLFFECHICHEGILKPKNYSGPDGFIIPAC